MKKTWREFKAFALSGSMLDLALGFLIATEFVKVIDPIANTLIDEMLTAAFGEHSIDRWHFTINGQHIEYGLVVQGFVNFIFFALVLFVVLKLIGTLGLGRQRAFEEKQCPYCLEYIPPHALVCKVCRQPLVAQLPDLDTAEARARKLRERRHLNLPIDLREFDLPDIPLPRLRRKPGAAAATPAGATGTPQQTATSTHGTIANPPHAHPAGEEDHPHDHPAN
jgi:large conductance mechanosensitive channel